MRVPLQKPHRSVQEVETPPDLIAAVERRFGRLEFDLAATAENAKASRFFTRADDALKQDWFLDQSVRVAWLNCEYSNIEPWAKKCREVRALHRWTLLLVPMGTQNWAVDHMWGQAYVLKLRGRVQFVSHDQGYPKDLVVAAYGWSVSGEEVWDWRRATEI